MRNRQEHSVHHADARRQRNRGLRCKHVAMDFAHKLVADVKVQGVVLSTLRRSANAEIRATWCDRRAAWQ